MKLLFTSHNKAYKTQKDFKYSEFKKKTLNEKF